MVVSLFTDERAKVQIVRPLGELFHENVKARAGATPTRIAAGVAPTRSRCDQHVTSPPSVLQVVAQFTLDELAEVVRKFAAAARAASHIPIVRTVVAAQLRRHATTD